MNQSSSAAVQAALSAILRIQQLPDTLVNRVWETMHLAGPSLSADERREMLLQEDAMDVAEAMLKVTSSLRTVDLWDVEQAGRAEPLDATAVGHMEINPDYTFSRWLPERPDEIDEHVRSGTNFSLFSTFIAPGQQEKWRKYAARLETAVMNYREELGSEADAPVTPFSGWRGDLIKTRDYAKRLIEKGLLDESAAGLVWGANRLEQLTALIDRVVGPEETPEAGEAVEELTEAEYFALYAAKIARREVPESMDTRVDRIAAQEIYLQNIARNTAETARSVAAEWRARPYHFSDIAGVSADIIGRYAGIIERQLELIAVQRAQNVPQTSEPAEQARSIQYQNYATFIANAELDQLSAGLREEMHRDERLEDGEWPVLAKEFDDRQANLLGVEAPFVHVPTTRDEIAAIPMYDLYRSNLWYVVRGDGNYGMGDAVFKTFTEATAYAAETRARDEANAKYQAEQEAKIQAELDASKAAESAIIESYGSFLSETPMLRARQRDALEKVVRNNGETTTRKKLIEKLVSEGYVVETVERRDEAARNRAIEERDRLAKTAPWGNERHPKTIRLNELKAQIKADDFRKVVRRFSTKESFYDESTLSKTALDYAEYLISQASFAHINVREAAAQSAGEVATANAESSLRIVADSWEKLRAVDVDRLVHTAFSIGDDHLADVLIALKEKRPALALQVEEAFEEAAPFLENSSNEYIKARAARAMRRLRRDDVKEAVREAYPDIVGAELGVADGSRFVLISPDVNEDDPFRVTYFSANGLSGHNLYRTAEAALAAAVGEGYTQIVPGRMDELSQQDSFKAGLEYAERVRKYNAGEISAQELYAGPESKVYVDHGDFASIANYWRMAQMQRLDIGRHESLLVDRVKEAREAGADTYSKVVEYIDANYPDFLPANREIGVQGGVSQAEVAGAWGYIDIVSNAPVAKELPEPETSVSVEPQTEAYVLRDSFSETNSYWQDVRGGRKELGQAERLLIDRVKQARDEGAVSYTQAITYIEAKYPGFFPPNKDNGVDGGAIRSEVAGAWAHINEEMQAAAEGGAIDRLKGVVGIGSKVGAIKLSDGKTVRAVRVVKIDETGLFTLTGSMGPRKVELGLNASNFIRAIVRAQPGTVLAERLTGESAERVENTPPQPAPDELDFSAGEPSDADLVGDAPVYDERWKLRDGDITKADGQPFASAARAEAFNKRSDYQYDGYDLTEVYGGFVYRKPDVAAEDAAEKEPEVVQYDEKALQRVITQYFKLLGFEGGTVGELRRGDMDFLFSYAKPKVRTSLQAYLQQHPDTDTELAGGLRWAINDAASSVEKASFRGMNLAEWRNHRSVALLNDVVKDQKEGEAAAQDPGSLLRSALEAALATDPTMGAVVPFEAQYNGKTIHGLAVGGGIPSPADQQRGLRRPVRFTTLRPGRLLDDHPITLRSQNWSLDGRNVLKKEGVSNLASPEIIDQFIAAGLPIPVVDAITDADKRFDEARVLLERNRTTIGDSAAQAALASDLIALAMRTPADEERTVMAMDILATRLGVNYDAALGQAYSAPSAEAPQEPAAPDAPEEVSTNVLPTLYGLGLPLALSTMFARERAGAEADMRVAMLELDGDDKLAFIALREGRFRSYVATAKTVGALNSSGNHAVCDSRGNLYKVRAVRHDYIDVWPVENGKPVVHADSTITFHTNPDTASGFTHREHDPLFYIGEPSEAELVDIQTKQAWIHRMATVDALRSAAELPRKEMPDAIVHAFRAMPGAVGKDVLNALRDGGWQVNVISKDGCSLIPLGSQQKRGMKVVSELFSEANIGLAFLTYGYDPVKTEEASTESNQKADTAEPQKGAAIAVTNATDLRSMRFLITTEGGNNVLTSGTVPGTLADDDRLASIDYYMAIAAQYNGELWVAPINGCAFQEKQDELIFGRTWSEIQAMQQGAYVSEQVAAQLPDGAVLIFGGKHAKDLTDESMCAEEELGISPVTQPGDRANDIDQAPVLVPARPVADPSLPTEEVNWTPNAAQSAAIDTFRQRAAQGGVGVYICHVIDGPGLKNVLCGRAVREDGHSWFVLNSKGVVIGLSDNQSKELCSRLEKSQFNVVFDSDMGASKGMFASL